MEKDLKSVNHITPRNISSKYNSYNMKPKHNVVKYSVVSYQRISNTIELIVRSSCYCVSDLLCVIGAQLKWILTTQKLSPIKYT